MSKSIERFEVYRLVIKSRLHGMGTYTQLKLSCKNNTQRGARTRRTHKLVLHPDLQDPRGNRSPSSDPIWSLDPAVKVLNNPSD